MYKHYLNERERHREKNIFSERHREKKREGKRKEERGKESNKDTHTKRREREKLAAAVQQ